MKETPEEREERKQREQQRRNARRNKRPKDSDNYWLVFLILSSYNNSLIRRDNMAVAYTKEFLINVFLYRFRSLDEAKVSGLRDIAERFYDTAGRDKFRVYASVTPEAVREYKSGSA